MLCCEQMVIFSEKHHAVAFVFLTTLHDPYGNDLLFLSSWETEDTFFALGCVMGGF